MSDPQTGQKACSAASEGRGLDALVIGAGIAGSISFTTTRTN